jgi:S1-C subfamily serine protease
VSTILTIRHLNSSLAGRSQRIAMQEGQVLRLGRGEESDIRFSDPADDSVSTTHAELSLQGGRLYIEDKRSSNGTFVNGAPCPPFQKIAVADGSRIRLAREGPEIQTVLEAGPVAAAAPQATAGTPTVATPGAPARESVGRATMLREIDRARQEERDVVAGQIATSRRSSSLWLTLGLVGVLFLAGAAIGGAMLWNRWQAKQEAAKLAARQDAALKDAKSSFSQQINTNVWADVEKKVSPAVVHIRCLYRLRVPKIVAANSTAALSAGEVLLWEGVTGSGVLIRPGLVLTAKHVVEPWKVRFHDWEDLRKAGAKAEYDELDVQFSGQQPLKATLVASSDEFDLALIQIQPTAAHEVPVVASNNAVKVTDRIAVISYPANLGEKPSQVKNLSGFGGDFSRITEVTPTFVAGNVTHPLTGSAGANYVVFDAAVTHGSSGGAVVNDKGELIGIVSQQFQQSKSINVQGQSIEISEPVSAGNQAVSPDDIRSFLRSRGVL